MTQEDKDFLINLVKQLESLTEYYTQHIYLLDAFYEEHEIQNELNKDVEHALEILKRIEVDEWK